VRYRLLAVLVLSFFVVASCGVSRDADEATDSLVVNSDEEGSDDDDDESETSTTSTTATPAPTSTVAADEVAVTIEFEDGTVVETLHGQVNDIVIPTQDHADFTNTVFQGQFPPGFDVEILSRSVFVQMMDKELDKIGASPSDADRDEAMVFLLGQLEGALAQSGVVDPAAEGERFYEEVPYLPFLADFQARQIALANGLAAAADPDEGSPCVSHILVETEAEGDDLQAQLADGADFAELAQEFSTGPTGPNGGELGCGPADQYVPEFAAAMTDAGLGEFVGPFQTSFGWHVLVVDRFEVDGELLANEVITNGLTAATVTVDERVGSWDSAALTVIPAGS